MTTKPHTAARVIENLESETRFRLDQATRIGATYALTVEQRIDDLLNKLDLIRSQPITPRSRALGIELTAELHRLWNMQVDAEAVATSDGEQFVVTTVAAALG